MATNPPFPLLFPQTDYNSIAQNFQRLARPWNYSETPKMGTQSAQMNALPQQPNTLQELDDLYNRGLITLEQANQYEQVLSQAQPDTSAGAQPTQGGRPVNQGGFRGLPPLNFAGSDLTTELYSLGMAIGAPKGTQGRTAGIIGGAGAAALEATRDVLAGVGFQRANNYADNWYNQQMNRQEYTPNQQYQNTNYLGGIPTFQDGGMMNGGPLTPDEMERLRQADIEASRLNGASLSLEGTILLTDPNELAAFEASYGQPLAGKRVWVSPDRSSSYVVDPNPNIPKPQPRVIQNEGPISGTKTFTISGEGSGIPGAKMTSVTIPYKSREELDQLEREFRNIKSYADYAKTPYFKQYGIGHKATPTFQDGGKQVGDKVKFRHGGTVKEGVIKRIENGKIYI